MKKFRAINRKSGRIALFPLMMKNNPYFISEGWEFEDTTLTYEILTRENKKIKPENIVQIKSIEMNVKNAIEDIEKMKNPDMLKTYVQDEKRKTILLAYEKKLKTFIKN